MIGFARYVVAVRLFVLITVIHLPTVVTALTVLFAFLAVHVKGLASTELCGCAAKI
jgi:hypothetical protein